MGFLIFHKCENEVRNLELANNSFFAPGPKYQVRIPSDTAGSVQSWSITALSLNHLTDSTCQTASAPFTPLPLPSHALCLSALPPTMRAELCLGYGRAGTGENLYTQSSGYPWEPCTPNLSPAASAPLPGRHLLRASVREKGLLPPRSAHLLILSFLLQAV